MMKLKMYCYNSDISTSVLYILSQAKLTCPPKIGLLHCASVVIILRLLFLAFSTYCITTLEIYYSCMQ